MGRQAHLVSGFINDNMQAQIYHFWRKLITPNTKQTCKQNVNKIESNAYFQRWLNKID